tara:strand:+ start:579 stop:1331 length:753 start_codon:yes stop_codon:yes gene_type:complete
MLYQSKASHLGSSLSVVETLVGMFSSVNIAKIKSRNINRDRIIISKGHCAAGYNATMHSFGLLSKKQMESYHKNNSYLAGHASHSVKFVEHSTGALGHGLGVAVGCAIGLKSKKNKKSLVLCLCGDGELQEGSIWESLLLASHKKLDNLVILIDYNRLSNITFTNKVVNIEPLTRKFKSFNLNVSYVDGHNSLKIINEIKRKKFKKKPLVIICKTIKGKGVKFAENNQIWNYRSLDKKHYEIAKKNIMEN